MLVDVNEIRAGNYFAFRRQVKQILLSDLINLHSLLPHLQPIAITRERLIRLNFEMIGNQPNQAFQKTGNNISFNFRQTNNGALQLFLNHNIGLPHIRMIHQLQNLYYDLSGKALLRVENENSKQNVAAVIPVVGKRL